MSKSREVWGYAVWGAMGLVIAVPELWAAVGGHSVAWPTISGTVGYLEYWHTWVALVVIAVLVWAAFHAIQYEASRRAQPQQQQPAVAAYRTPGGRVSRKPPHAHTVPAVLYFAVALAFVVGLSLWSYLGRPHDKYRLGEVMYGSIAFFWIVVPAAIAFFGGRDVPFPTLFATIQALERHARIVAVIFAGGITILLIHLALYPWPAVIPDLQDLHKQGVRQPHAVKKEGQPPSGSP